MELEELIKSVDIVEYISQFVDLEEKNGEWWGLSPFRDEKTPSFSVRRETGKFYDFSSGIGGTLICFVKKYFNCSGKEAINKIKEYAGAEITNTCVSNKLSATKICKQYAIQKKATSKKISKIYPENYMERYEVDYDKLSVWESEGISRSSLEKFDVKYDSFSNRIVYPIKNIDGQIVNIGGRTLEPDWKERGIRKYTYFSGWGAMDIIYGLYENMEHIKEKKEVILFEGCKSVLMANTWGIHNCGALLTSHLNPHQMKILAKLGVRVVFALDKEVRVTEDHNISKLKRYVPVEYLYDRWRLLEPKDAPVDKGEQTFRILYDKRVRMH